MTRSIGIRMLVAASLIFPAVIEAQEALPLGSTVPGRVAGAQAEYVLELDRPGFLAVVLRAEGESDDLVLSVTDDEGQVLSEGRSDQDIGGRMGAEQVLVQIPFAGRYGVRIEPNFGGSGGAFEVGATFLPTMLAEGEPDPDRKPSGATELGVDGAIEDSIDPTTGDGWDWYKVTSESAGVLTVLTRAVDDDGGDLRLDVFRADDLSNAADGSDQDQNGTFTNESVSIDVAAGETIFVKVSPSFIGNGHVAYRIASGLIG